VLMVRHYCWLLREEGLEVGSDADRGGSKLKAKIEASCRCVLIVLIAACYSTV